MRAEPASLELRIDYQFVHAELLRRALTHSSLANESHTGASSPLNDNEQLEFLGDSVLGLLVAEALVRRFPEYREGDLSRLKAHLVCAAHLHGVARRLDLGAYLELGRGEEMSGGRTKKTLLVNALEAIIGAIWLDGGLEATRAFVAAHVLDAPFSGDEEAGTDIQPAIANFKSALEELAQAHKLPQPRYSIVREQGPQHSKTFTAEVRVGKDWSGQADGRTKKIAAQRAARGVYDRLRQEASPNLPSADPPLRAGSLT
jgi:ribonuclease-3